MRFFYNSELMRLRSLNSRTLFTGQDTSLLRDNKTLLISVWLPIGEDLSLLLLRTPSTTLSLDGNSTTLNKTTRLSLESATLYTPLQMDKLVPITIEQREKVLLLRNTLELKSNFQNCLSPLLLGKESQYSLLLLLLDLKLCMVKLTVSSSPLESMVFSR